MHDRSGSINPENDARGIWGSEPALTRRRALMLGAAGIGAASLGPVLGPVLGPGSARAAPLEVTIDRGNFQPIPIALPDFLPGGEGGCNDHA